MNLFLENHDEFSNNIYAGYVLETSLEYIINCVYNIMSSSVMLN